MRGTVLVVEPDREQALVLRDALLSEGHDVHVTETFEAAAQAMSAVRPRVLVTAVRLGAFNGLHLVIRKNAIYPEMRAIVMGLGTDQSRDVDHLGVRFLLKPVTAGTITTVVAEEIDLGAEQPLRRWPRKLVHLPAVVCHADIDIVDLSYGGLRFQGMKTPVTVGSQVTVNVPSLGVSVTAVARWTKPLHEDGECWWGAEILDPVPGTTNDWRVVVDSVA